ncbi:hypothetical protein [Usitatibacter palustris]|uniref:Membrane bound FAD containing D-sorbitol dehydrogenase n=1 Tax=Usitatibacter palustris TaxID=2732487 RepID=A0A6M4H8P0_9PROT|nr:hypothetical protein [Usitatibacter palustris]QJR15178.1 hypothetical protein DSM104440_01995 [Usitatibacter palustris]
MVSRRRFLQVGLAGAAVLVTVGLLNRRSATPAHNYRVLDEPTAMLLHSLVPVILAGSLPKDAATHAKAVREVVEAFDRAISALSPAVQTEIDQLMGLLRFAPTRIVVAGVASPWDGAAPEDIAAFLQRWRTSRFDLLRAGYQALTQLTQGAWYGNPLSWPAIGYLGPPKVAP